MRHFFPFVCSKIYPIPGSAACGAVSVGFSTEREGTMLSSFPSSACGDVLKKCSMDSLHTSFPPSKRGITVFRPLPLARNRPAACGDPMVAESPILRGWQPARAHILSIRQKVCSPLSDLSREWISSMTINLRSAKREGISICLLIISDSSDSGVI